MLTQSGHTMLPFGGCIPATCLVGVTQRVYDNVRWLGARQPNKTEGAMAPQIPRVEIYAPDTLAVMNQAFMPIWKILSADDPFRNYDLDSDLRVAIRQKLMDLVADGVTNPVRLQNLAVES